MNKQLEGKQVDIYCDIATQVDYIQGLSKSVLQSEVSGLKQENQQLKELVADLSLKNVVLKKSLVGADLTE